MKINTICFILLFFILISAASAADSDNETLQQDIQQPDDNCQVKLDDEKIPEASDVANALRDNNEDHLKKLSLSNTQENKVEAKNNNVENILSSSQPRFVSKLTEAHPKSKVKMSAGNVKMYYHDGSKLLITLKNKSKKPIANAKVSIKIDNKIYTKNTDSKGKISLKLNLNSGKYTAEILYKGSSKYYPLIKKCTITVKSTIKPQSLTKFYKNKTPFSATFYDKKGKVLKNTAVKFKVNGKIHTVKTNKKGVAKVDVNSKPGFDLVYSINPKTSETISSVVIIKSLIETKDLTMNDGDGSKFNVKVFDSNGKASPSKKVTIKVNGQTFTPTTDKNGIASLPIDYEAGRYIITTEYEGLKNTNQITVNPVIKKASFSHITMIPDYVNVTIPYAFQNSQYTLKTGFDGIIKLPKKEIFTVQISKEKGYLFSSELIKEVNSITIGYKTHLIPFDGSGVKSDYNKANLKGDGILISRNNDYTQIEYRSSTEFIAELFGVNINKGPLNSETLTYVQNNEIKAKINFYTYLYDDYGLKYSLAKYYGKSTFEIDKKTYEEITDHNTEIIKFVNNNKPANLDTVGISIGTYMPPEELITKFIVNGVEELEKEETISYGHSDKYKDTYVFEAVQSYAIINEKVTKDVVGRWASVGNQYLMNLEVMDIYGMFLAALQTAWLADDVANEYAKEYNVIWKRGSAATIMGGINLEDTYIHVLNADMGMKVIGDNQNVELFKFANSLDLAGIEEYVLQPIANEYGYNNTTNSRDDVISAINKNNYSIAILKNNIYIFDGNESALVMDTASGICNAITSNGKSVYKGSKLKSKTDCCTLCNVANAIFNSVSKLIKETSPLLNFLTKDNKKTNAFIKTFHKGFTFLLSKMLSGGSSVALGLYTQMSIIQSVGTGARDLYVDEKDWHGIMDFATFTRPGLSQNKKIYNIPNKNGGIDYIEVKLNDDYSLDRNNAKYISQGKTRVLTKEETYKYFTDEYWTPFSMPQKYWDKSWR